MCCGAKSRTIANANRGITTAALRPPARPTALPPQVQFEYVGKTRMTVLSPITGIRYQFDAPGAQVVVDARDQAMMIHVPDLRPLRFTRNLG
jgi:hypothetical protein